MRQILLALILLAFAVPTLAQHPARSSVYQLTVYEGNKQRIFGSAVLFQQNWILTAAHNIPADFSAPRVFIIAGGQLLPARIEKLDRVEDIALLKVNLNCPCIPLATNSPATDDDVVLIGYPYPPIVGVQVLTTGQVQGTTTTQPREKLVITAGATSGSSGGGAFVLNKQQWTLVGIVDSILPEPGIIVSFVVPPPNIRTFLKGTAAEY